VGGAGIWGCGIESQLESWYRFLIQPDPYAGLVAPSNPGNPNPVQMWQGVDTQILRQRKDFLRPDSLVAIVVLSDENDSEIDVRSLGGQGYYFMRASFTPPHSTSACATNPGDQNCKSCSVSPSDPACTGSSPTGAPYPTYSQPSDWGYDLNLRHVHMKAKYGVDPQYPIGRYVNGLQSPVVPDRFGEYQDQSGNPVTNYMGRNDCTNPLFAASLPDGSDLSPGAICNQPLGLRTKGLVFYAVIGGVPNQLLHFDPNSKVNSELSDADWVRILGKGPASMQATLGPSYDYTGIDPHMIEDYRDRTTVNYPFAIDTSMTGPLASSSAAPTASDPVNGREWVTDQEATAGTHVLRVDRQYACTFPLPAPRDCTVRQNANACDCPSTPTGLLPQQLPPVCNPSNPTQQIGAKAYPTVRELLLARLLGRQAIVSSLCPIHVTDQRGGNDPLYGYRPAVTALLDRMGNALGSRCLPEKLPVSGDGSAACSILVAMPAGSPGTCLAPSCDPAKGLTAPDAMTTASFCAKQENAFNAAGGAASGAVDPATQSVCQLTQLTPGANAGDFDKTGACVSSPAAGWCYVQALGGCAQTIQFAPGTPPAGSVAFLTCP
jgi:hypothetical protein